MFCMCEFFSVRARRERERELQSTSLSTWTLGSVSLPGICEYLFAHEPLANLSVERDLKARGRLQDTA